MVIHDADRIVARRMYQVAVGMVAAREDVSIAEYAQDALDIPTPSSIRALLAVGRGQAWLPSVIDALAEVGIAAADDVLSGSPTHEEFMAAARPIEPEVVDGDHQSDARWHDHPRGQCPGDGRRLVGSVFGLGRRAARAEMSRDIADQVEWTIARERSQWSALIQVDDGTPEIWEDLVRRSAPYVHDFPYIPRWEATSAFTPSAHPTVYKLPADLAAEWQAYHDRWEHFLDLNPRARIAYMLGDCSESHNSSSFPHGWEHVVHAWALKGFPDPAPFYANSQIRSDAWKSQLLDAMRRAGDGWVYMNDAVDYEWRS